MSEYFAGEYHGERRPLFRLAIRTALLTAGTIGIYRFWAKTRIRKYVWSSIAGDGDSFEYTGTGLEKFLGFLAAIVILAIYMGIIQMILFFFGMNMFSPSNAPFMVFLQYGAFVITGFTVAPLMLFAQYRARRYKLARTRWRGVRFGAEQAAWGYVWRAIIHWTISIVTLGLLLPRQTFYLEKYKTDRTWFGDVQFVQLGTWGGLYPAMKHLVIGIGLMVLGGFSALLGGIGFGATSAIVGYIWAMVGFVSYRVRSFEYLTNNKVLGGEITIKSEPETGTIVKRIVVGGIVLGLVAAVLLGVLAGFVADFISTEAFQITTALLPLVVFYMFLIAIVTSVSLVWITQPIIEHLVHSITVHNISILKKISQRAPDVKIDAEGFADALDVGGAI